MGQSDAHIGQVLRRGRHHGGAHAQQSGLCKATKCPHSVLSKLSLYHTCLMCVCVRYCAVQSYDAQTSSERASAATEMPGAATAACARGTLAYANLLFSGDQGSLQRVSIAAGSGHCRCSRGLTSRHTGSFCWLEIQPSCVELDL